MSQIESGAQISHIYILQTELSVITARLSTCMIVASENGKYITAELAIRTLEKAIHAQHCDTSNLILHSDQGVQFASLEFTRFCSLWGITQSMSRAGTPYDNAPMERYYNTLKAEEVYLHRYDTVEQLDEAINEFAYVWYNQVRPHSYNGYKTPCEKRFELIN